MIERAFLDSHSMLETQSSRVSKKYAIVTLSTCEAEYFVASL
jgi:hypothetical protein